MTNERRFDVWASGDAYEPFVGRWSRLVARQFVKWLDVPPGGSWLDVGCGTGALTETILAAAGPASVEGIDPSEGFVAHAAAHVRDPRASFRVGDARELPFGEASFDAVASALVLNFVPEPERAVTEQVRVVRGGGTVAAYVWDYAVGMELLRHYWDAVVSLDHAAAALDEGIRFPVARPDLLRDLFVGAGLESVEVRPIDIPTRFVDFDDYWRPFLGGQGPAPSYAISLSEERRDALRDRIRSGLPVAPDGSIALRARAWAVKGRHP
jgi:SAM-dependent methyltransferase